MTPFKLSRTQPIQLSSVEMPMAPGHALLRGVRDPNTDAIASVWICSECVGRIAQILAEQPPGLDSSGGGGLVTRWP